MKIRGHLDLSECFIDGDGTLVVAEKGPEIGKTKRGKGSKVMTVSEYEVETKRTLLVLVSSYTLTLLARMKSRWYTKISRLDTSRANLKS